MDFFSCFFPYPHLLFDVLNGLSIDHNPPHIIAMSLLLVVFILMRPRECIVLSFQGLLIVRFYPLQVYKACTQEDNSELTEKVFQEIVTNKNHKLHGSLPPRNNNDNNLRNKRTFNISFCTQPYKNSFITYNAMKM